MATAVEKKKYTYTYNKDNILESACLKGLRIELKRARFSPSVIEKAKYLAKLHN